VADRHRKISVGFVGEEKGGAALEMALVAGLAAFFAYAMKYLLADPLLANFSRTAKALSQALGG
jgi:Flp pilus assembly pilin Flp